TAKAQASQMSTCRTLRLPSTPASPTRTSTLACSKLSWRTFVIKLLRVRPAFAATEPKYAACAWKTTFLLTPWHRF
ncbi:hypothetical protein IW143_001508, partial [Coemansia sp. RSA 520]